MTVQEAQDYASYVDAMLEVSGGLYVPDWDRYILALQAAQQEEDAERDAAEFDFSYLQPEPDYDPCPF